MATVPPRTMRVAVISDIHGNLHALEAVLAEVRGEAPDEIWCLGDVVGYGPRPNECCAAVRDTCDLVLVGNHDLAAVGTLSTVEFGQLAAASAHWTASVLTADSAGWLRSLRPAARRDHVELFHGSPRDPVWEYVLSEEVALLALLETSAPVVLVGHSHLALALGWDEESLEGGLAPLGTEVGLPGRRWLLNPGSVGQPRDGDPRAAWLLIDIPSGRGTFRRTEYPIERTQAEMRGRGLPEALAERLAQGV